MTTAEDSEVYNAHWALFPLLFAKRYTLRTYANFKASRTRTKVGRLFRRRVLELNSRALI